MPQRPTSRTSGRHTATRAVSREGSPRRGERLSGPARSAAASRGRRATRSSPRSAARRRAGTGSPRRGPVVLVLIAFLVTVLGGVVAVRVLGSGGPEADAPASPVLTAPDPIEPDMTGFDPGRIIDDDVFFDSTTMTREQVADLIARTNAGCRPGRDGTVCLASATFTTPDAEATAFCPGGYEGAAGESAADVIVKVARSCDVNPQVLLTLLQKEQGLLTASGSSLSATDYASATGYACPDGSECDPRYKGFFNQVYGAASQFQRYRLSPSRFTVVAGQPADVAYSPDPSCGSAPLTVSNEATAGLYNYTPYQPNAAAAHGGDDCTSWGNWNFYGVFRTLFGDPTPSS